MNARPPLANAIPSSPPPPRFPGRRLNRGDRGRGSRGSEEGPRLKHVQQVLVAMAVAACFLIVTVARAAWVDAPSAYPTLSGLELPLNTTSATQRKEGLLTVNKTFTANSGLNVGGATGTSQICWNDPGDGSNCKPNWTALGVRPFVHLYPDLPGQSQPNPSPPDSGYAALTGTSGITLKAQSGTPDGSAVFSGVAGFASSSTAGFSAGVFGDASTVTSGYGWAVRGDVFGGGNSAFAAYFMGKVAMFDSSDLIVGSTTGPNVQQARQTTNTVSEVCLNDVCKSRWESAGTSLWSLSGSTLFPSDTSRSVSSGNAAFIAKKSPSSNTVDVSVNGNTTLGKIVVGNAPTSLSAAIITCGDGMCTNPPENDVYCSTPGCGSPAGYYYCPLDCDQTRPGNVVVGTIVYNSPFPGQLTITWAPPADPDYAGTRVIVTLGAPPTGPFGNFIARSDIAKPGTSYESAVLDPLTTYYFILFAYDLGGNFASGFQLTCTAGACAAS